MKRLVAALLASISLLPACRKESTTTSAAPAKPAAPAETPKPPAEAPKPLAEKPKPPVETPKAPAETPKAPAEAPKEPAETAKAPTDSPKPATEVDMDAAIKELMARPEQQVEQVEVQHILIGFKGAPRMTHVTRSKEEAKALAEKVYAEVIGGADFDAMVKKYTDDSAPGIYPMTQASRKGMAKSFGDVGFHLKVGEIGVAPWDAVASPFGWHIMKRLK